MQDLNHCHISVVAAQVRKAVHDADQNFWAIGDALLIEVGPPVKGDRARFRAALAEVHEEGLGEQYDVRDLRAFRDTSYAFPPESRRSVSWDLHRAAGTPEFLDAILAGTPKGTAITVRYLKELRWAEKEYARLVRKVEAREQAEAAAALGKLEGKS